MPLPKAPTERGSLLSGAPRKKSAKRATPAKTPPELPITEPVSAKPVVEKSAIKVQKPAKTAKAKRTLKRVDAEQRKLFVTDTNVLLHDPMALFRFHEHDVFIPMIVLEELDQHKKGMSEVARNARQMSRQLDSLVMQAEDMQQGVALDTTGHQDALGTLFFQTSPLEANLTLNLPTGKADNQILSVTKALQTLYYPRQVVLVSKDINMRLKAKALGMAAEDYRNDNVLEDTDLLPSGILALPDDFWEKHIQEKKAWQAEGHQWLSITSRLCQTMRVNHFVYSEGSSPLQALVTKVDGNHATLKILTNHMVEKNNVWGICARNREQNFALNILLDPNIDFVTLLGQAGTGKTLLALAAGLSLVMDKKYYNEIIITRATISVGEDIGFLPGSEEEKMQPWMGALDDNLEVLNLKGSGGEWGRSATLDLIRARIKIKSLNFMRGRTFLNKLLIIDEAQNLTPKQMKTLITRAGPGTKVICLGNIAQIDTPYLSEGSSGLTYVVDRFQQWEHAAHITLQRGERSRLADHASEVL